MSFFTDPKVTLRKLQWWKEILFLAARKLNSVCRLQGSEMIMLVRLMIGAILTLGFAAPNWISQAER